MYIRKRTDQSWVQLRDLRFGVFQKTAVEIYFAITVPNIGGGKSRDLDISYRRSSNSPRSMMLVPIAIGIGTGKGSSKTS